MFAALLRVLGAHVGADVGARATYRQVRHLDRRLRRDAGVPCALRRRLEAEEATFPAPLIAPRRDLR